MHAQLRIDHRREPCPSRRSDRMIDRRAGAGARIRAIRIALDQSPGTISLTTYRASAGCARSCGPIQFRHRHLLIDRI